jgi:hypothetical protein
MKPFVASLVLTSAVVTTACDNGGTDGIGDCQTLRTALSVKDRMSQTESVFNPGEAITFELSITNTTIFRPTLMLAASCVPVVFAVFDAAGRRLWGNFGVTCVVNPPPLTFQPMETVTESLTWNQVASGGQVPSGRYDVAAEVGQYVSPQGLLDCGAQLNQSASFLIQ